MIRYGVVLASVLGLAADSVTLDIGQYVNANRVRVLVFQGTISSRQAAEYVEILGRYCGASGDRLITGTQTRGGGAWRIENPNSEPPYNWTAVYSGTTFRARWERTYSEPYTWLLPAQPRVAKVSGTRTWVAHVSPATPTGQIPLKGKTIELQRRTAGGWVTMQRARLAYKPSLKWGAFNYEARFKIPTRGLTLRVHLPQGSAAPCYLPGSSATFRS
ncbi:MAG: hypothetical protein WD249_06790 [Gaiellaceae bacterium]